MKKEKTTKKKGSVMTTREKMLARKKDLEKRSGGGGNNLPERRNYQSTYQISWCRRGIGNRDYSILPWTKGGRYHISGNFR